MRSAGSGGYRSLFISDLHLGSFRCDARRLCGFLDSCHAENIILVGDVFDFWSFAAGPVWSSKHAEVVLKLFRRMTAGNKLVVVPGNHDEGLADFIGLQIGGLQIHHEWVHQTASGERFLVVHGHEQDGLLEGSNGFARSATAWRQRFGAVSPIVRARRLLSDRRRWTDRAWERLRHSLGGVGVLENKIAEEASQRGFDGVICGHTHIAADRRIHGVRYLNCGDWLRNATAIAETKSGELQLLRWRGARDARPAIARWRPTEAENGALVPAVAGELP